MTPIKYVGIREAYEDPFGNRDADGAKIVWKLGEQQYVTDAIAKKMLGHPSVFVRGRGPARVRPELESDLPREDAEVDQDSMDLVATMDKDAIAAFVKTYFNLGVDKRASVETLRQNAINLICQYGVAK